MILVDADVSEEWDSRFDWEALSKTWVYSAVEHSEFAPLIGSNLEVSVKFTSDEEVRALNATWRGQDKPTNVLSFPMEPDDQLAPTQLFGDIVLAHGVCAREADERSIPVENHAAHLVVHGMLHLLGYDHETGDEDAEEMEEIERKALASLGIADPYAVTEVES